MAGHKVKSAQAKKKGGGKKAAGCSKYSSTSSSSSDSSLSSISSRTRSKKRSSDFRSYLYKVLREIYEDTGITKDAMDIVNTMVHLLFECIATEANCAMRRSNRSTMTASDIQTAVRKIVPGELQKHAVYEGTKAVAKFKTFTFSD